MVLLMKSKCRGCGKEKSIYPLSQICPECYQREYYHENKIRRISGDKYEAIRIINGCMKAFSVLREANVISELKFASLTEDFGEMIERIMHEILSTEKLAANRIILKAAARRMIETTDPEAEIREALEEQLLLEQKEEPKKIV